MKSKPTISFMMMEYYLQGSILKVLIEIPPWYVSCFISLDYSIDIGIIIMKESNLFKCWGRFDSICDGFFEFLIISGKSSIPPFAGGCFHQPAEFILCLISIPIDNILISFKTYHIY